MKSWKWRINLGTDLKASIAERTIAFLLPASSSALRVVHESGHLDESAELPLKQCSPLRDLFYWKEQHI